MGWFVKLCRNTGLMIHNVKHPDKAVIDRQVVDQQTQEKKLNETVTLRRTTTDEIEIRREDENKR